ncbi:TIR domain-containing protein [Ruminococcus sp.]|uniref:TIR domain-containing protein n=1 Tax=Ruminococcus sp. TaxID=41978 RepID=UPI0025D4CE7D|nr:TIR domain-containing protein [Ruminococcus sp.]MCR4638720.1 TIR domain-containing protein [Ruminococcus sp.]
MEYKYKAFISYRHIEPDMQAAERLQKLLEAYKPPKSLGIKKENWRIFRDVSEIQSSSDLSEIIKNAIESSEYLIVICSPQYTESKWCLQELTRFRELHDNKNTNIITLLVNGDPRESFPKELTYAEVTTTNEKGEEVTVKVDVEPLAANIVSDNIKDSMKKLNTEYLRIAAPLLGCDFNDLFQREKRREAARRRRIFGGVSGILSLISIISIASAVTINGKNKQIQKQNDQIKEQNAEIENKNSELLVENAGHLAVESENLFKESSLIPAVKKAVEALPSEGEEKPVLPEAEYALSRELGMFKHTQTVPQLSLKHECAVEQLSFMGGGKSVVSQDATGVYFWDAETGKLIKKLSVTDSEFASEAGSSNELTAYFDIDTDKTGTYFNNTSAPSSVTYENSSVFNKIYTCFVHAVDKDEPGTGGDVYITNSDKTLWRIDGATGEIKWKAPKSEKAYFYKSVIVDEKYVLRMFNDKRELVSGKAIMGDNIFLEIIDRETGKEVDTVKLDFNNKAASLYLDFEIKAVRDGVVYAAFDSGILAAYEIKDHALKLRNSIELNYPVAAGINTNYLQFINNEPVIAACSVMAFTLTTDISRCDKDMKEKKWTASLPVNYQNNGKMFLMSADTTGYEHDVLAVTTNRTLSFVDYENGKLIKHLPIDGEMVDVSFSQSGLVMFTLASGEEYTVSLKSFTTGKDSDQAAYRVQTMTTKVSLCSYSLGRYVTAENYSNTAYIQYPKTNSSFTDIDTGEFMYNRNILAVSDDGSKAAVVSTYYPNGEYKTDSKLTNHLFIYDTASGSLTEVTDLEGSRINSAAFIGNDKFVVNTNIKDANEDSTMLINVADGKASEIKDAPQAKRRNNDLIPTEGGAYYLADMGKNIVFISADGGFRSWAQKDEDSILADKAIVNEMYAVSGSKAAMLAELSNDEGKTALIVHDFSVGQHIELKFNADSDTAPEVQRIFWQGADTVGVLFSDRTVGLFDATKGVRKATVSLNGTSQEPVSVVPVSDDKFAVLCRDSHLYEMNAEGFTGRSCRLDFASDYDNNIYESDSSSAALLETKPSADAGRVYAVWDKSHAWLLDTSRFNVRYRIDDFSAASKSGDKVFISDENKNKTGFFPVYTTKQLLGAARDYLSALGEA